MSIMHRVVVGAPGGASHFWYWDEAERDWVYNARRASAVETLRQEAGRASREERLERPVHAPIVEQLDHLASEGWEVVTAALVAPLDRNGHEQVGFLMRRIDAADREPVHSH